MREAKDKRIVVFLDYDGTLSPIVNDPDKAFMSDLVRKSLMYAQVYSSTIELKVPEHLLYVFLYFC